MPWIYLPGISARDFPIALEALLARDATGLSASSIVRLKRHCGGDFAAWCKRDLSDEHFVYCRAGRIYLRIRQDSSDTRGLLVIMRAIKIDKEQLVAVFEALREIDFAWYCVLMDLKMHVLEVRPFVAVGGAALSFWQIISRACSGTNHQRGWVHGTRNIFDNLPKNVHGKAKELLKDIYAAEARALAGSAMDHFNERLAPKHPKAVDCLNKNREELLACYDYQAEDWVHLRTTILIEPLFATIRLRTQRIKGHGSMRPELDIAFKSAQCAEKNWKKRRESQLMADVLDINIKFVDGEKAAAA